MTDDLSTQSIIEMRRELSVQLWSDYRTALVVAQTTHDPDDWLKAGSIFRRYAAAAVTSEISGVDP